MKYTYLLVIAFLSTSLNANSQDLEKNIDLASSNDDVCLNQKLIPVNVNLKGNIFLNIHFTGAIENVSTTIEGPEGIVYQQQITAPKGQSVSVNLQPFQEGEYTITFQDAKGNEVEGTFTKETEN